MSLYNMVYGVNPATFFLIPMLGDKHTDDYPRFRDCFLGEVSREDEVDEMGIPKRKLSGEDLITVYTRTGGGNREEYEAENAELQAHPNYIKDYDDDFDSTFASFVFSVPDKWKADFALVKSGDLDKTSKAYQQQVDKVFPKLEGKLPWHEQVSTAASPDREASDA